MSDALQKLGLDFERARIEALLAGVIVPGAPSEPDRCRYCGKHWRKWKGSTLDGHAKCIVPLWFKRQLRELYRADPALTYSAVGDALGVSASVVRSWVMPISNPGAA